MDDAMPPTMKKIPLALALLLCVVGSCVLSSRAAADATPRWRPLDLKTAVNEIALDGETLTLRQALVRRRVPAISIALIADYQLVGTLADGVKQAGGRAHVTPDTLMQAASISKSVAAATAMKLVQLNRLSLDGDVNRQLKSWQLREYSAAPAAKVTLRRLLSMTAGINLSGFAGYSRHQPLPTLVEILNGQPPAQSLPVQAVARPGDRYAYSGGGYEIVEQLIADVAGQGLAEMADRLIFKPTGMRHTFFLQPLPPKPARQAASGHLQNGQPVAGQWRVFPELAAAGLWSTPADLARFVIAMMDAFRGASRRLLDQDIATEMLTLQDNEFYGLGFVVQGTGRTLCFLKQGHNAGYQDWLVGCPNTGQGAVVMTNADGGGPLAQAVIQALAQAFHWPVLGRLQDGAFTSTHQ